MKFHIAFERVYPHSINAVWRALTEPEALGEWLMETDFVPELGRAFRMQCENAEGGTDRYLCKVIEIEPQSKMLWSWILDGHEEEGETYVEFMLEPVTDGTRLTVRHSGDRDPSIVDAFKSGWPHKLDQLEGRLAH